MRPFSTLLAFACLLVLASPARAQQPLPEDLPDSQAAPSGSEVVAELQRAVQAVRAALFTPGERLPGWNAGGADPDADLRAAGAQDHYFLLNSVEGPAVTILSDRRITDFASPDWRVVDSYGSATDPAERPFLQYSWLSPRYVLAMRANSRRQDNLDCTDRVSNALLYEVPGAQATEGDADIPIMFRMSLLAIEGQIVCTRYFGDAESGWRMQALLPDGRSLPALDRAEDRLTIVDAAPVASFLRRQAAD